MSRRSSALADRAFIHWGVRGALALGMAWLGYGAVTQALAYAIRGASIERAYALAPDDGRIGAILSEARLTADPGTASSREAGRIAQAALRHEPLAVAAVATLGLNAELIGSKAQARRILTHAETLSRRDLRTQLWQIEDAVGRGDIKAALHHYDIALRTSRTAPELLYPILAQAVDQADIRAALIGKLSDRPAWGPGFIDYAASHAPTPQATMAFLNELRRAQVPVSPAANTMMVNTLLAGNRIHDAWSYYRSVHPKADLRFSRDPNFSAMPENPSAFDWMALSDAGMATAIQQDGKNGLFDFSIAVGVGGPMLRQMQLLPAGQYILSGRSAQLKQPDEAQPYFLLACTDGRELGRVAVPNSDQHRSFTGRFTVTADCPVQYLTFVARPSDQAGGVTGQIERVELRPVG